MLSNTEKHLIEALKAFLQSLTNQDYRAVRRFKEIIVPLRLKSCKHKDARGINPRASESGGYLLSHDAFPQSHRRCCVSAPLLSALCVRLCRAPLRPPPPVPRASDASGG